MSSSFPSSVGAAGYRPSLGAVVARLERASSRRAADEHLAAAAAAVAREADRLREQAPGSVPDSGQDGASFVSTADAVATAGEPRAPRRERAVPSDPGRNPVPQAKSQPAAPSDPSGSDVPYGGQARQDGVAAREVPPGRDDVRAAEPLPDRAVRRVVRSEAVPAEPAAAAGSSPVQAPSARARVEVADGPEPGLSQRLARFTEVKVQAAAARSPDETSDRADVQAAFAARERVLLDLAQAGQRQAAGVDRRQLDLLG
ncbi:MAG: hypothetical protein U1F60_14480 [Planctomycetota bacterium]